MFNNSPYSVINSPLQEPRRGISATRRVATCSDAVQILSSSGRAGGDEARCFIAQHPIPPLDQTRSDQTPPDQTKPDLLGGTTDADQLLQHCSVCNNISQATP